MSENLVTKYVDNVKENKGAHLATAIMAVAVDRTFDVVGKTKKIVAGSKVAQTLAAQFNRGKTQVNQTEAMVDTMAEMTDTMAAMRKSLERIAVQSSSQKEVNTEVLNTLKTVMDDMVGTTPQAGNHK